MCKKRKIDQWNTIAKSETNPHIHDYLASDQDSTAGGVDRNPDNKWCWFKFPHWGGGGGV